jgi:hypothetical protein
VTLAVTSHVVELVVNGLPQGEGVSRLEICSIRSLYRDAPKDVPGIDAVDREKRGVGYVGEAVIGSAVIGAVVAVVPHHHPANVFVGPTPRVFNA